MAIRGGGHNVGGRALCDDGIVIDLSRMRSVYIDAAHQRVRVQGGSTLGDLDRKTHVSSVLLSRYAGNYQMEEGGKIKATVRVSGDQLMFSLGGNGAVPLTTLSETNFFFPGGFPLDFVVDAKGAVTNLFVHAPCGDFKFVRTETSGK